MRPIIIVAAGYTHQSNGITAMHHLCHSLNLAGADARMMLEFNNEIFFSHPTQSNPVFNTPLLKVEDENILREAIVIYPEVMHGNPLANAGAHRVVRWMGNKEGVLRKNDMGAGLRDFILAHSKVISDKAHHVLFYCNIKPEFLENDSEVSLRHMNATYIGKGHLYGEAPIMRNTLLIERHWPCVPGQLAWLLRRIEYFYTWDCWTQTNLDAIISGCIPVFMRYKPFTSEEIDGTELGVIPRINLYQKLDAQKFAVERATLMARMIELQASWDQRVAEFNEKVQEYFA
jgi:hypothetical protein